MSQTKKTYTLGKIKQLIDLNGDSTNFDLSFKVTCQDDTPFQLLVVDQTTLDNTPELIYKEANNTISGNIVADKNVYQNYFLILKSEKNCLVDVELTKKNLPRTPTVDDVKSIPPSNLPDPNYKPKRAVTSPPSPPSSGINWKKIGLIIIVLIIGAGVLWWMYKKKGKSVEKVDNHVDENFAFSKPSFNISPKQSSSRKPSPELSHTLSHNLSPTNNSKYKPSHHKPTRLSPDVMSQTSYQSSARSDAGGDSLLHRLRKFAR
jgi:hypothetical protein